MHRGSVCEKTQLLEGQTPVLWRSADSYQFGAHEYADVPSIILPSASWGSEKAEPLLIKIFLAE